MPTEDAKLVYSPRNGALPLNIGAGILRRIYLTRARAREAEQGASCPVLCRDGQAAPRAVANTRIERAAQDARDALREPSE